jgi:hypothetical protein
VVSLRVFPNWVCKIAMRLRNVLTQTFRIFLHRRDLTYARLKKSSFYLGLNPRNCYKASISSDELSAYMTNVSTKISQIPLSRTITNLLAHATTSDGVSHLVFELSPDPEDENRRLNRAHIGAVSKWALNILLADYETRQSDSAADFYHSISTMPSAGSLRGRIFERQVLMYFASLEAPQIFKLRSLAESTTANWTYPGCSKHISFSSRSFTSHLENAINANQSCHLVPQDPNFPAVDSILYDLGAVLALIQVTINPEHPVAISGLNHIQGWLKKDSPALGGLRPSTTIGKHWKLVFVVPESLAADFKLQRLEGDSDKGGWARKIDQYVLGLPENALWGRTRTPINQQSHTDTIVGQTPMTNPRSGRRWLLTTSGGGVGERMRSRLGAVGGRKGKIPYYCE